MNIRRCLLPAFALALAACGGGGGDTVSSLPTATLAPLVSMTPRFTATPVPSRTPLPTDTYTPSPTPITPTPSDTFTPSPTPPITGIVASLQTVNVRQGPGVNFSQIRALVPGTGVEILGQNEDGNWLNIRMEDGTEGWIATSLVRVNPTPTPFPTSTPSPDLTALALGTPLPTAVLGGGTITPTPPRSVVSPTPVDSETAAPEAPETTGTLLALPVIDLTAVRQTAVALSGGTLPPPPQSGATTPAQTPGSGTPTFTPVAVGGSGVGGEGSSSSQQGVDVLAYCDNPVFGNPAPTGLQAGATIDIFWSWFASDREYIQQHVENAIYDVRINGTPLQNWRQYATRVRQQSDGNYWIYWFVPYGPLPAGQYTITYSLTWRNQITDGYDVFGPGTNTPSESGTCTFTVR
ncbi:MAG: SH3 domain-containing protein [Chloroflexi bacterium]|nr:SH3 domain-containing protein [Chloroflexota bacterium]